jgi:hypothetical protein
MQLHVNRIRGLYLKCLDKFQEGVPLTKTKKKFHISIHLQTLILLQGFERNIYFYLRRNVESSVHPASAETEDISPTHFYACQSIRSRSQTSDMMRQSMIRRVHACIDAGGRFCSFYVNCDLINNKKPAVLKSENGIISAISKILSNSCICC